MMQDLLSLTHESARSPAGEPPLTIVAPSFPTQVDHQYGGRRAASWNGSWGERNLGPAVVARNGMTAPMLVWLLSSCLTSWRPRWAVAGNVLHRPAGFSSMGCDGAGSSRPAYPTDLPVPVAISDLTCPLYVSGSPCRPRAAHRATP